MHLDVIGAADFAEIWTRFNLNSIGPFIPLSPLHWSFSTCISELKGM